MRTTALDGEEEELPAADGDGLERLADADVDGEEGLDGWMVGIRTSVGSRGAGEEEKN